MSNKRYNVLWLTSWYPDNTNPVMGIFVREHARAVSAFDDITVLHLLERQPELRTSWELFNESDPEFTQGLPTFRYRSKKVRLPLISDLIFLSGLIRSITGIINNNSRIDLLHAHTYRAGFSGTIISKYLKIPLVITEHSSIFPSKHLTKTKKAQAQIAFKSARVVMPVSDFLEQSIRANSISANFKVIGNTFDPNVFFYSPGGTSPNTQEIITVCNLKPEKNIDQLLCALSRLPKDSPTWNLSIVGSGPEELRLRSLASQLGIQDTVQFLGVLSKSQVAERLRQSDFFVLPSLYETFSVATLEALACGLPVLVTRSGGPEEFVSEDSGILIPLDNVDALLDGLISMLRHAREYQNEEIASKVRKSFSLESIGYQIHQVYESILG